ncbi:MAG: UxaA family hydrolase [Oscillibacter sp.]|nr:UxaA family hydrolase [Oscillibacter sp.]
MADLFYGYERPDGKVGSRNYVAVIPSVVCANEVVEAICGQVMNCRALLHHQGCCQLPPDLERVTDTLISLACHPNAGAVLVVSLGCEGTDVDRLLAAIEQTGKPYNIVRIQEIGGTAKAIADGIQKAQRLSMAISGMQRKAFDLTHFIMGIKCGGSDATSGLASNCAIGYVADKIVDQGGTVIFGEVTEFIGAEHILARRGRTPEVGAKILQKVEEMENRAKSLGCDMRKGQPTPGNIEGGLTTIEEKSLGAIMKSGSRTIEGVLEYPEMSRGKGLWIKDTPGREIEILTGMAASGAQCITFSTGRGAPQGFPILPVIKICGNPNTYERMSDDMDLNAGRIILGEKSIEEVGEELYAKVVRSLSGEQCKGESIYYSKSMDIWCMGPVI